MPETDVGIVGGAYLLVDERRGRALRADAADGSRRRSFAAMARYVPIAHTVATFRRRAWIEAGGYPPANNLIDLRFYLRAAKLGWRLANVPEVVGEHYVHGASFFHRTLQIRSSGSGTSRECRRKQSASWACPSWMYVFALGRHAYAYLPTGLKRVCDGGSEVAGAGSYEDPVSLHQHGDGRGGQPAALRGSGPVALGATTSSSSR